MQCIIPRFSFRMDIISNQSSSAVSTTLFSWIFFVTSWKKCVHIIYTIPHLLVLLLLVLLYSSSTSSWLNRIIITSCRTITVRIFSIQIVTKKAVPLINTCSVNDRIFFSRRAQQELQDMCDYITCVTIYSMLCWGTARLAVAFSSTPSTAKLVSIHYRSELDGVLYNRTITTTVCLTTHPLLYIRLPTHSCGTTIPNSRGWSPKPSHKSISSASLPSRLLPW